MKSNLLAVCTALFSCLLISETATAASTLVMESTLEKNFAVSTRTGRKCVKSTVTRCVLRVYVTEHGSFWYDVNADLVVPPGGPNEDDALDLGQEYTDAQEAMDAMTAIIESGDEIPYLNPPEGE